MVISAASAIPVANFAPVFPELGRLFRPSKIVVSRCQGRLYDLQNLQLYIKNPHTGPVFSQKNFTTYRRHRGFWEVGTLSVTYFFRLLASFFRPSKNALTEAPVGRTWGVTCSGFPDTSAESKKTSLVVKIC